MDVIVRRRIHGGTGCYEVLAVRQNAVGGTMWNVTVGKIECVWPPICTIYDDGHISPPMLPQEKKDALRGVLKTIEDLGDVSEEEKCAAIKTTFLLTQ